MEQIKKNRNAYQKKYRDKKKAESGDKPKKNYYKSPKRNLCKSLYYKHDGINYSLMAFGHSNEKGDTMCEDVFVSFYIPGLDFLEKFEIDSVYHSKHRAIDLFWKKIKLEIEAIYPETLIVFNYSTTFNSDYKKGKNGVFVDLHKRIPIELFSKNVLDKHKDELIKISLDIKNYIKKNLEHR